MVTCQVGPLQLISYYTQWLKLLKSIWQGLWNRLFGEEDNLPAGSRSQEKVRR